MKTLTINPIYNSGESIFGSSNQNSVGLATAQENLKTALMDSLKQANRLTTDGKFLIPSIICIVYILHFLKCYFDS